MEIRLFGRGKLWKSKSSISSGPSVTDPVKPDPMDYFPSPSDNLASPRYLVKFLILRGQFMVVPMWLLYIQRQEPWFLPAYIICVCLKRQKQRPDRKGKPGEIYADQVMFSCENLVRIYRCHWACYRGVFLVIWTSLNYIMDSQA